MSGGPTITPPHRLRESLRLRICLALVGMVVLIVAGLEIMVMRNAYAGLEAEADRRATELTRLLSDRTAAPLRFGDAAKALAEMQAIADMAGEGMLGGVILGPDGGLVGSVGPLSPPIWSPRPRAWPEPGCQAATLSCAVT